jgi:hypothetical protein
MATEAQEITSQTTYDDNLKPVCNSVMDFFPFYLNQHKNNFNRLLHYSGTLIGIYLFLTGIITLSPILFIYSIIIGYGFAWTGHFFFEKNKPASFGYPLYSFLCDYVMLWHFLTGQLQSDLKKYGIRNIKFIPLNII